MDRIPSTKSTKSTTNSTTSKSTNATSISSTILQIIAAAHPIVLAVLILLYFILLVFGNIYIQALCILYATWVYIDNNIFATHKRGSRPTPFGMDILSLAKYNAEYYPLSLVKDEPELVGSDGSQKAITIKYDEWNPNGTYVFGIHPHGFIGHAIWGNFATNATGLESLFPTLAVRLATLNLNFYVPFAREILLLRGFVSASKSSIRNWLLRKVPVRSWESARGKTGRVFALVVGGAEEAFYAFPGKNDLILKKRKGFVKLALQTGAQLVPVYCFRQNSFFHQFSPPWFRRVSRFLQKHVKFAPVLVFGRFGIPFAIPFREPCVTVIGRPVSFPTGFINEDLNDTHVHVSEEMVDKYHESYVNALVALYDKYKDLYDADRKSGIRFVQ